jgi:hypothetical protein
VTSTKARMTFLRSIEFDRVGISRAYFRAE